MKQARQLKKEQTPPLSSQPKSKARSLPAAHTGIDFTIQKKENHTGLPDHLKSGIENLSGHAMDDVKVHYNSSQPAQLNAHAYAQGNQIHIAPGQEKHLAHEAWHVVQQKQGRVKPTKQLKSSVAINDSPALEKEADVMGSKALRVPATSTPTQLLSISPQALPSTNQLVIQRQDIKTFGGTYKAVKYDLTKKKLSEKVQLIGSEMKLEFHATDTVDCDKIGLTQTTSPTVKKLQAPRENYAAARGLSRSVTDHVEGEEVEHARYFDRTDKNNHPVFGAQNGKDLVPTEFHSEDDKLGAHVLDKNGKVIKDAPAVLLDMPGRNWEEGWQVIQSFETTAVCLNGPMKDDYLGSVEWGYTYGPNDEGKVLPFKKISDGMPTKKFIEAVAQWNKAKIPQDHGPDVDTVKLPEKERIGNDKALSLGHRHYMLNEIKNLPLGAVLNLVLDPDFSEHSGKLLMRRLYDIVEATKVFTNPIWTEAYKTHPILKTILNEAWDPQDWTVDAAVKKLIGVDEQADATLQDLAKLLEDEDNITALLCLNPEFKANSKVGGKFRVPNTLLSEDAKAL